MTASARREARAGVARVARLAPAAPWALLALGVIGGCVAAAGHRDAARAAAAQDWPPFVLVTGLLLIGLVAEEDGLFAAAGHRLARTSRSGLALFTGATLVIAAVTATLNLDTSVAYLTPVLVYTARSRGEDEAPLLVASVLLANASSLFLPGSNLTNLIVLGHDHVSGGEFLAHMWPSATAAVVVTAFVIGSANRSHLRLSNDPIAPATRPVLGLGVAAIALATAFVLIVPSPAVPVLVIGAAAVGARLLRGREAWRRVVDVVAAPVLVGLFGLAVLMGTVGRVWSGPASLLAHLDPLGTAAVAAASAVLLNNLPAASLLAARAPIHPYPLLIGLNLGPNLFVTGSLAWLLWLRAARAAGAQPSVRAACRVAVIAVPLSIVAAVAMLGFSGSR